MAEHPGWRSAKVIRPGVVTLLERAGPARQTAERETHARVAHLLTKERARGLDELLVVAPELKSTRLNWLVTGPVQASPNSVGGEVEKLRFLRGLDRGAGHPAGAERHWRPQRPRRRPDRVRAGPLAGLPG
ncbi:hypothetical protein [Streptomyces boncukensis]|uniref:Uncharacterized protein n=1 Tax=Streptomyces boncukensis TaxID=2711219 RepID=A0A6G4WS14_9ACTN|nr:hypothetical protein [Streptomyces boncukensis]NGO67793.1 hypothetical protein [Streptomyces boncukensis]